MEDERMLKNLIAKRGSIKAQVTHFNKNFDKIQTEDSTVQSMNELRARLGRFETLWDKFDAIQTEIETIATDVDSEYAQRELFQDNYFRSISSVNQFISNYDQACEETSAHSLNQSLSQGSINQQMNIKLPTINLPNFDGDYMHWREFYDTFRAVVHNNDSISPVQKLCYLRSSLTGDAKGVIRSFETSDENYAIAWDLLKQRYDNKRRIILNHGRALLELSGVTKESHVAIRQVLDTVQQHLRCLQALGQDTDSWNALLIPLISSKLDLNTNKEWEARINADNSYDTIPTLGEMVEFLTQKCNTLEAIASKKPATDSKQAAGTSSKSKERNFNQKKSFVSSNVTCFQCKGPHAIYYCQEFIKLPINARIEQVKFLNLCTNCLRPGHGAKECDLRKCKTCNKKHNTLLHYEPPTATTSVSTGQNSVVSNHVRSDYSQVLLATVLVNISDSNGKLHACRALLDCGSQSNFITEGLFNKLKLHGTRSEISIVGINQVTSNSSYKCNVQIQSRINNFRFTLPCLILNKICERIPNTRIDISNIGIPNYLKLADPSFNKPGSIDLLLGSDIFWQLLCVGQIRTGKLSPILQRTQLGWVVTGPVNSQYFRQTQCNLSTNIEVQNQLAKFWEIEEVPIKRAYSTEEKQCELHFEKNVKRDSSGRFVVAIPLKDSLDKLGKSHEIAKKRFYSLERKLQNNPVLKKMYTSFMEEYITMDHMSLIESDFDSGPVYYMPHHGVLNENSTTTKLRVVFDGSCPTSSGVSINNLQMVGPTMQQDLFSILLRFRQHTIVISADIAKMYRQVLIHPDQRQLQRVVWRSDPTKQLQKYQLNTVTYGTASASFLVIRCLQELAFQNIEQYPIASQIIIDDFYVDDLLTGAQTVGQADSICKQVERILSQGQFKLHKWVSNEPAIFTNMPQCDKKVNILDFGSNENSKTLGLLWTSNTDQLSFNIEVAPHHTSITKRLILSSTAQIFDPLGLLSACTVSAKIILQELWQAGLSWDEAVPTDVHTKWTRFRTELSELNNLKIPRHTICKYPTKIELHCFSDSSERAYGACIYIRSINHDDTINCHLLCAKSKVAPLKTLSIPRLELCGALVGARLAKTVTQSSSFQFSTCNFWCDSSIVLAWIRTPVNLLKTFACNRVAEIQEKTNSECWNHIISKDNPADLLSRGVSPASLNDSKLWWHGPDWLSLNNKDWPQSLCEQVVELPEMKSKTQSFVVVQDFDIFEKYSSLHLLQGVIAYCIRFCKNVQLQRSQRNIQPITVVERVQALHTLIKIAQQECFKEEINLLSNAKQVKSSSKLFRLNSFIDEKGFLRVGGRLVHLDIPYEKKHPLILPSKHALTRLIAIHEHKRLLHCGPQALLNSLRDQYWPISGRDLIRQITHQCVTCFRVKPRPLVNIMGNLPKDRITPTPAFYNCGVDFAGPCQTKDRQGRGCKIYKSYICLFICMCTKAIHLELVSDLSTACFLAAFRRFTARRGRPANIYSDNGTNFIGANNELQALGSFLVENKLEVTYAGLKENIQWHFIPASSPHFGGLWEAGVKSTKYHLKRVLGNALLTFEDFYTLLVQIESILNSRPISPMSTNPNDLDPLTPAHFLIGRKLTTLPDPDLLSIPENRLSRFQRLQHINQHFWTRWSKEYISELQQRVKWNSRDGLQAETGTLVLIKEDNLPPLQWRLGRIEELHPGSDGIVRVVSIRTQNGIIKRAIVKVCPFPQFSENEVQ